MLTYFWGGIKLGREGGKQWKEQNDLHRNRAVAFARKGTCFSLKTQGAFAIYICYIHLLIPFLVWNAVLHFHFLDAFISMHVPYI